MTDDMLGSWDDLLAYIEELKQLRARATFLGLPIRSVLHLDMALMQAQKARRERFALAKLMFGQK